MTECATCLQVLDMDHDDVWRCRVCRNVLHLDCFDRWRTAGRSSCPFCRHSYETVDCTCCAFVACVWMCASATGLYAWRA